MEIVLSSKFDRNCGERENSSVFKFLGDKLLNKI